MISDETRDPNGRVIPDPTADIAQRLSEQPPHVSLHGLADGGSGTLSIVLLPAEEVSAMNQQGFVVGARIKREGHTFSLEGGKVAQLSDAVMKCIFVNIANDSA